MAVAQQGGHHMQNGSFLHQHAQNTQPATNQDQSAQTHEQQNHPCNNAGVCHFACIGYLAAVAIEVNEDQPLAQTYAPFSTQFQSITSTPLDPPPLARA